MVWSDAAGSESSAALVSSTEETNRHCCLLLVLTPVSYFDSLPPTASRALAQTLSLPHDHGGRLYVEIRVNAASSLFFINLPGQLSAYSGVPQRKTLHAVASTLQMLHCTLSHGGPVAMRRCCCRTGPC
jgi:hypothetical protein